MGKQQNTVQCMFSELWFVQISIHQKFTNMNLKDLKKPLQLKWRVKDLKPDNKNPKEMVLVPYVDARQIQDRLDDVVGGQLWQDDYFEVKGKQFCKIGIKIGEEWIWKGDSGIESYSDASKGETSDAFKRAAVHWGINRDTYELGEITITCKVVNELPVPVDSKGNQLSGDTLLAECKRISALKDSELKFDRNVLPAKSTVNKMESTTQKKRTTKAKIILP